MLCFFSWFLPTAAEPLYKAKNKRNNYDCIGKIKLLNTKATTCDELNFGLMPTLGNLRLHAIRLL